MSCENSSQTFSKLKANENEDYKSIGLEILRKAENYHFWFISRKEKILSVFNKYISRSGKVIEVGAGTGNVSQYLIAGGYNVAVGEMHFNGLKYAQQYGIRDCYQFDLFNPPFEDYFDTIGLFDVLEHLDDDILALKQCSAMLKSSGKIVLTIPAFNFLWSRDDRCGHKRRYTIKSLRLVVEDAGLNIIYYSYFFRAIMPLLILRHFIYPDNEGLKSNNGPVNNDITINPIINKILLWVCRLDNKMTFE